MAAMLNIYIHKYKYFDISIINLLFYGCFHTKRSCATQPGRFIKGSKMNFTLTDFVLLEVTYTRDSSKTGQGYSKTNPGSVIRDLTQDIR
jgi:hypothetical protein